MNIYNKERFNINNIYTLYLHILLIVQSLIIY